MDPSTEPFFEEPLVRLNRLCDDFESACRSGKAPRVEAWLTGLPSELRTEAFEELLALEVAYRQRAGDAPSINELVARFPQAPREWLTELSDSANTKPVQEIPTQLGDYRIVERIGSGGMGTVYKAVHQRMGRTVALKLLRRELNDRPDLLRRFNREVRAAARLTHPNIVAALDAREESGLHYLITEYVPGCDLNEMVRQQGPLPVETAVDCILQAARGLEYAHSQGVVHRDIKPANLLRGDDGVVKILDMGLARFDLPEEREGVDLTMSGVVMGTAAYMSPEQGRDTRRADARSDLYSLGCTLYFLLTGRSMFSGATAVDMILSHVSEPIPKLSAGGIQIPPDLERVFRTMVAKEPGERFQTAGEVIAALEACRLEGGGDKTSTGAATEGATSTSETGSVGESNEAAQQSASAESATTNSAVRRPAADKVRTGDGGLLRRRRAWVAVILACVAWPVYYAVQNRPIRRTPGERGFSLEFNGGSSYMTVPTLEPAAGESYTVEVIVESLSPQPGRPSNVVSWLGPDWMALYRDQSGRWGLARRWRGRSIVSATTDFYEPQGPVHLTGVFSGAELRLYIAGREAAVSHVNYALDETSGGLFVGGVPAGRLSEERGFRGRVHGLRISRGVRYETDFTPPARLIVDEATLAVFPFSEGEGDTTWSGDPNRWAAMLVHCLWNERTAGGD